MTNIFTRPGMENFFKLLGIWGILVLIYVLGSGTISEFGEMYLYYIQYYWPNFLFSYVLLIYVIPNLLDERNYKRFTIILLITLCVFVIIRYLNNSYWQPDYYITWNRDLNPVKETTLSIIVGELSNLFPYTVVSMGVRLFVEWRLKTQQRNRLEYEKVKAELATLRYQLNPHFMLNAMNNIYYLSLVKSDLTPVAVLNLSEQLRYMLYEKAEWVELSKEIGHLKALIEFHQIRFPDDQICLHIDADENFTDWLVPPLIFLTFIENAFKHGIPGTKEKPTLLSIFISNEFLTYRVENQVAVKMETALFGGAGLDNLKRRLDLVYSTRYSLVTRMQNNVYFSELKIPFKP